MKLQLIVGLILISFLLVPPLGSDGTTRTMVYAQTAPVAEKGQNFDTVVDENNIVTWTSHADRILVDNEWQDYQYSVTDNKVIFNSNIIGGLTYDIPSCSYSLKGNGYNGEQVIPSVSIVGTVNNDGVWSNHPVNDEICSVEVTEQENGITIESTKVIMETITEAEFLDRNELDLDGLEIILVTETHKLIHTLKLDIVDGIKETFEMSTNSLNNIGISQTIHTGESIEIGGNTIDIQALNGQSFDRDYIIENEAEILALTDSINYDFDVGIDALSNVNIIFENNTYKVNLDYADGDFIGYLHIDPTFTVGGSVSGSNWNFSLASLNSLAIISAGDIDGTALSGSQVTSAQSAVGSTFTTPTVGSTVKVHSFTSGGNFVVSTGGSMDYLVVAGGGGGGGTYGGWGGGGGGAGGMKSGSTTTTAQTYSITVGGGGGGSASNWNSPQAGGGGGSSGLGISTSGGGGGGNKYQQAGGGGGSGGGDSGNGYGGGSGIAGEGRDGGTTSAGHGGGGGGKSAEGQTGGYHKRAHGGAGGNSDISGSGITYAGGGGGGCMGYTCYSSSGGSGGGGQGGGDGYGCGGGTSGLGGGGGGNGYSGNGCGGGSGIVIISYADSVSSATGGTVTTYTNTNSSPTLSLTYTLATVPDTPSAPTASFVSNTSNTVSWSAPSDGGASIDYYHVYRNGFYLAQVTAPTTTYTNTGITIGTSNYYSVLAHNTVGNGSLSANSATIISANLPATPTLTATTGVPIVLAWSTPQSDMTITNYKIYRDGSLLTTLSAVNTYNDSATAGNTYSYTVSAVSGKGEGSQSSAQSATAGISYNTPTNVDVTIPSPNSAPLNPVITWTASTCGSCTGTLTGYEIFRDGSSITTVGLVTTYTDTVTAGTYSYILQSTSNHGSSGNSSSDSITTATAPSQPTLSLTPISTSQIDLSWTASSANGSNLLGYQIERSTNGSSYQTVVANTNTLNTVISSTSLSYDSHYWYRVAGINNVAVGTVSAPNDTWTMIDSPTSFLATGVSTSQIDLSWTAPSTGNILGYHIERESPINSGTWIDQVANTGNTNVVNSITGLASSVTYNLRVSAINSGGSSVPSGESSASSWGILSAPVLDTLTQVSPTEVKLDWTAPTGQPSVTGYDIERQLGSGWVAIQTPTATNAITYTDSTLASGEAPSYRIYAINSLGTSPVSNELTITQPSSGGGGGGSSQVVSSVSNLVDIINLNILDDIHRVILGQQLSDSVKVMWDSTDNLEVISIVVADSPVILTFQSVPFIMIADPSGLSEGRINYSVQIPNMFCSSQITINCIEPTQYDIPVEITAKYGTKQLTAITVIKLDMKEETDIPLVFLLGAIALPVGVLVVRSMSKHTNHSHKVKVSGSSGKSRKNGSGKSNLSL